MERLTAPGFYADGGPWPDNASELAWTLAAPGPQTELPIDPAPQASLGLHYSVTIVITVLVGILFFLVYLQLILVICFGYKLLTYQTVLLFDILLWAALRLTLYSFYFYHCCEKAAKLHGRFLGWFLISLPPCLQYFSLALLVRYFGESIFKVLKKRQEMASLVPPYKRMRKYKVLGEFLWAAAIVIFLGSSITFHFLIDNSEVMVKGQKSRSILVILRVILLDGLFLVMGITLGVCIIIIYTTRAGKDVLETQTGKKWVAPLISCLLILLFTSRDIYSLVGAISGADNFNSASWIFVTDEGDYGFMKDINSRKDGYIAYFAVLMVWEVIPTYIIVFFFRVRLPSHSVLKLKPCKIRRRRIPHTNQKHFFENPNRYDDENDQLLQSPPIQRQSSTSTHVSIPSLTGSNNRPPMVHPYSQYGNHNSGYGSTQQAQRQQHATKQYSINSGNLHHPHGTSSHPAHGSVMPGTTPPQLFTSPSFFTDQ